MPDPPAGGLCLNGIHFLRAVGHEIAYAAVHGESDVGIGFVVGVEVGLGQIIPRQPGGIDLAGGYHVDPHALGLHDLIDALEGVGLAGVQGAGAVAEMAAKGFLIPAAVGTKPVLIHEVQRGAVLPCQLYHVLSGEEKVPAGRHREIVTNHSHNPFPQMCEIGVLHYTPMKVCTCII